MAKCDNDDTSSEDNSNASESDEDTRDYEAEIKYIDKRFPNAKFDISIDVSKLKDKLSDETEIVIKQTFCCGCYLRYEHMLLDDNSHLRPPNKYFVIRNDNMTIENIIDELIKQNMTTECDHRFLEGFDKETHIQYSMFFGS